MDDVQLGLDNLKDILKGEDYKLDNSTLLGVRWPLSSSSSSISDPLHQVQRAQVTRGAVAYI